ncbi:DUF6855 family protein [Nocardioides sp.]
MAPPVLEALGLAEVEHHARNNRIRALWTDVLDSPHERRDPDVRPQ